MPSPPVVGRVPPIPVFAVDINGDFIAFGGGGGGTGDASAAKQDLQTAALNSILAKIIVSPATEATLAAVLAKLIAAPATEATLAAIQAKIIVAPSTEAGLTALGGKLDTINTSLNTVATALPPQPLTNDAALTQARINITTATTTVLAPAVAGQTTRVHRIRFKTSGAVNIEILDGATVLERFEFAAGEGILLDLSERSYYKTSANTALNMTTSAAVSVQGRISYVTTA